MTPERWQHVKTLYFQALDRPPDARPAFLDQVCGADAALRAQLHALLDADAPSILDASPDDLAQFVDADGPSSSEDPYLGQAIGPYRVIREIGHGGMGTVYLAARADDAFRRHVALKVVRRGLDTAEVVRRFAMERQILAGLTHPHIARLLDGGATDDGVSYLVMEYVEGLPITRYCDTRRFTIDERLRLFRSVCDAVHYAHQNLVVHRDLKPSNILVTPEGTVKLLDFGIAKLLNPSLAPGDVVMTRTAFRIMTPEYASPEQVRGEPITTVSDVYALGVVLYELLTGHRPYRLKSRAEAEIYRAICEDEPERLSAAISRIEEKTLADGTTAPVTPETVSAARHLPPDRLRRRLAGDLENVISKAMRKEPQRRYASAEQLAEDLRRHQIGVPILARKPTVGYRVGKFVRRHRVGVVMTTVFLGLLLALGGLYLARVTQERDRAEAALAQADVVKDFLLNLFEASDPFKTPGDTLTSFELLARGVERVEELSEEPEVKAQVLAFVGEVYERLEQFEQAESLLTEALALRQEVLGNDHPDVAQSMHRIGWLLRRQGDYEAAEPLFREALAIQRAALGDEHLDVARTMDALATLLRNTGDYDEAEPLFREVLATRRALLGEEHELVAISLNNLALLFRDQGAYTAAEPLLRTALTTYRTVLGEEHPYIATGLHNLGLVMAEKAQLDTAESLLRQALAMDRKLMGEERPDVATDMHSLARVLRDQGKYTEAEALFLEALAMRRRLLGLEHPRVAQSLHDLAVMRHREGNAAAAEPLFLEALAMRRKLLGPGHPDVARSLHGLADLLRDRRDYAAAEPLYQEALAILRARFDDAHHEIHGIYAGLSGLYEAWGKPEEAAVYARSASQ